MNLLSRVCVQRVVQRDFWDHTQMFAVSWFFACSRFVVVIWSFWHYQLSAYPMRILTHFRKCLPPPAWRYFDLVNRAALSSLAKHNGDSILLHVLGNGAGGNPRSVILDYNDRLFMFNCGEGLQRLLPDYGLDCHKGFTLYLSFLHFLLSLDSSLPKLSTSLQHQTAGATLAGCLLCWWHATMLG